MHAHINKNYPERGHAADPEAAAGAMSTSALRGAPM
jgi:hypothetical protein